MKGTVYINHRPGSLDAATLATAREVESEMWWKDCLKDGGVVLEIQFQQETHSSYGSRWTDPVHWNAHVVRVHYGERQVQCPNHPHIWRLASHVCPICENST